MRVRSGHLNLFHGETPHHIPGATLPPFPWDEPALIDYKNAAFVVEARQTFLWPAFQCARWQPLEQ